MVTPRIMLLQIFAACPAPASPQCTAFCPMMSKRGLAVAKACVDPPAIKVSVPPDAPPIPPDTGASTAIMPASSAACAVFFALSTSTVEQSMNSVPCAIWGIACAATCRRIDPLGSIVITASMPATAASRLSATRTPSAVVPATSKPATSWPALARLVAIGAPMLPSPINPIFMLMWFSPVSGRPRPAGAASWLSRQGGRSYRHIASWGCGPCR